MGTDYLSHGLWDKYLAYELAQNDTLRVAAVYQQVLGTPIRELDRYCNRCAACCGTRQAAGSLHPARIGHKLSSCCCGASARCRLEQWLAC